MVVSERKLCLEISVTSSQQLGQPLQSSNVEDVAAVLICSRYC